MRNSVYNLIASYYRSSSSHESSSYLLGLGIQVLRCYAVPREGSLAAYIDTNVVYIACSTSCSLVKLVQGLQLSIVNIAQGPSSASQV